MIDLRHGDSLEILHTLPDNSVDAVITDPPYPEIDRTYGRWTEKEWWSLIVDGVVPQVRRVLKPTGSAVFILQPNSRKVGSMRGWLWEFMAWCCREWNVVQDAYWWNHTALPLSGTSREQGLMRSSVKACVWCGPPSCWRDQGAVLWAESQRCATLRATYRANLGRVSRPGPGSVNEHTSRSVAGERGGTTPFNLLPFGGSQRWEDGCVYGHGASTPLPVTSWWVRYVCPSGGVVLDPFLGSGTTALACLWEGRSCIGIEKDEAYHRAALSRVEEENGKRGLFADHGLEAAIPDLAEPSSQARAVYEEAGPRWEQRLMPLIEAARASEEGAGG